MQFGPECLSKVRQFASDADAFLDEDGARGQGGVDVLTAEAQLALLMEVGSHGVRPGHACKIFISQHNALSCPSCLQPESHYDDAGGCCAFTVRYRTDTGTQYELACS